jgi:hypothetical protein
MRIRSRTTADRHWFVGNDRCRESLGGQYGTQMRRSYWHKRPENGAHLTTGFRQMTECCETYRAASSAVCGTRSGSGRYRGGESTISNESRRLREHVQGALLQAVYSTH